MKLCHRKTVVLGDHPNKFQNVRFTYFSLIERQHLFLNFLYTLNCIAKKRFHFLSSQNDSKQIVPPCNYCRGKLWQLWRTFGSSLQVSKVKGNDFYEPGELLLGWGRPCTLGPAHNVLITMFKHSIVTEHTEGISFKQIHKWLTIQCQWLMRKH